MISENEKLLIASKYKKTSKYILDMASNYPHKYLELKTRIINTTFMYWNLFIMEILMKAKEF